MGFDKKIIIGIVVAIAVVGGIAGALMGPDDGMTDAPAVGLEGDVTIGLILPLTGDLSTHGEENWEGSKLGVEDFNAHLEEIGEPWQLVMISEDSATNPVTALEKLTSLNAKGISAIIGPETSSNTRNIKGYADSNNMLLISCCSTAPSLAIPGDSVYRLVPDDNNQGTALAKLMQEEGIEVMVPVWRGDTWGDGLSEATAKSFTERGGMALEGIRYNPDAPEFSASTSLLAQTVQEQIDEVGADKVAVLFLGFAEILQFMQSASDHESLDQVRWFGPDANTKEKKLTDDPIGKEFSNKIMFTTVQAAASTNPTYERVHAHVEETLGRAPSSYVHSSYDAVWLVGLAMLETQSTDITEIKSVLHEVAEGYTGAIGNTKLNEAGDLAQADYEVWGIRDGQWVRIGQYDSVSDSIIKDTMMDDTMTSGLEGDVTIGLILPLTGDLATHGEENWEGSKLAVEDFNAHLEEIGEPWQLKMISEDSATNPVVALDKLTSLSAKGIGAIIGPETSSNTRNIKGYADANNMLLISCCSSAPALAIPGDSVYRLVPDDTNQGTALAKLIHHEEIEIVVPVWRADTWGDGLKEATANSFTERGGTVTEGIRYNPESPEFSASTSLLAQQVQEQIDEAGADKVAVMFLGFAEVLQFMQSSATHESLDKVRWFGPGAITKEYKLINDPIGLDFSTAIQFTTIQVAVSTNPTYERVQSHVEETLGRVPNSFVHSSYDAVWLVGLSMLETGSSDITDVKSVMHQVADEYVGAIGDIKLNEAGDLAQANYEIWGIRDANWVSLGQYIHEDDSIVKHAMTDDTMMKDTMSSGLEGEIAIGSIAPLTGSWSTFGQVNWEAIKLGVDDFNAHLEETGEPWQLKLISEDSETKPEVAREKIESLYAQGVGAVIGPETSANILKSKEFTNSNDMLILSCCSSAPELAIPGDSVYRLVPDDTHQGSALAKLMRNEGIEVMIPAWRTDAWGNGYNEAASNSFTERGGTVTEGVMYDPGTTDFSTSTSLLAQQVQEQIDEVGADKVAVMYLGFDEVLQFMQSSAEHDVLHDVKWFASSSNNEDPNLIDDPVTLELSTATDLTTLQVAAAETAVYERVRDHITEATGRVPNTYIYSSYDAAWLIGLAMLEAGSADISEIKAVLPKVAEDHDGMIGHTKFNEAGDVAEANYEIWGIRDGSWAKIGMYNFADDSIVKDAMMDETMTS